jgi:hypothetical protein
LSFETASEVVISFFQKGQILFTGFAFKVQEKVKEKIIDLYQIFPKVFFSDVDT